MADTRMSQQEREAFLASLHVGVLSIPTQGAPLTAPIWYDYQPGADVWVLIGRNSQKGQLVKQGVRVSLVAQQEALPYAYVSVEGTVTAIRDATAEDTLHMATRYLGDETGKAYAQANSGNDSVHVAITPDRWLTVDYAKSM